MGSSPPAKTVTCWKELNGVNDEVLFLSETAWSREAENWVNELAMVEGVWPVSGAFTVAKECLNSLQATQKTCCAFHNSRRRRRESPFNDIAHFCDPFELEPPYDPNTDDNLI